MKYLEELFPGDSFKLQDQTYILTSDFKKKGDRYCIDLNNGSSRWILGNTIVEMCPVYTLDKDNNIIAIKPTPKNETN